MGVDIGGTSVRALVTDAGGRVLGYQRFARVSRRSLWQVLNDCLNAVLAESAVAHVEAAVIGAERVILAGGLLAPNASHCQQPNALRAMVEESLGGCKYASYPVVGACWAAGRARGIELDKVDLLNALEMRSDSRR